MSAPENGGAHEAMEGGPPPIQARLTITLLGNGSVHVDFPQSGVVAFGMLHEAQRIITKHFDAASAPMIQPPNGAPRGLLGTIKRNLG